MRRPSQASHTCTHQCDLSLSCPNSQGSTPMAQQLPPVPLPTEARSVWVQLLPTYSGTCAYHVAMWLDLSPWGRGG